MLLMGTCAPARRSAGCSAGADGKETAPARTTTDAPTVSATTAEVSSATLPFAEPKPIPPPGVPSAVGSDARTVGDPALIPRLSAQPLRENVGDESHPSRRRAALTSAPAGPSSTARSGSDASLSSRPRRILAAMTRMNPGTRVADFGRNVHSFSSSAIRAASAAADSRLRRSINSKPRAYMPKGPRRADDGSAASRAAAIARDAFVRRGLNVHTLLSFASAASCNARIDRT